MLLGFRYFHSQLSFKKDMFPNTCKKYFAREKYLVAQHNKKKCFSLECRFFVLKLFICEELLQNLEAL